MHFTASPLTLQGNQYFTGIGMDITEQRSSRQQLEENYSLLDNAMDLAHMAKW